MTGTDAALGKPQRQRRAHGQAHLRQRLRRSTARATWPRECHEAARASLRRGRADRRGRARADHRLHPDPHRVACSLHGPHPRPHRPPAGPPRALRGRARPGRPGGARAHHRHGRRDRRALRRQPRHLRAGGRAALAAGLADGQDRVGRRPPGLPAQGPHRPPRPAADDPPVRGPRAVLLDRGVRARHHGRRPRLDLDRLRRRAQGGHAPARRARRGQGRRGHRRRRHDRRGGLRGHPPGRRPGHADRRRPQRQRDVDRARTSARCRATSTACA